MKTQTQNKNYLRRLLSLKSSLSLFVLKREGHSKSFHVHLIAFIFPFLPFSDLISSFCDSLAAFKWYYPKNAFKEDPGILILSRHARFASDNVFLQFLQFFKISDLKNFAKFTWKHLCQTLFGNTAACCQQLY